MINHTDGNNNPEIQCRFGNAIKKPGICRLLKESNIRKKKCGSAYEIFQFLMLIYTGCHISELLDLRKEGINLPERWYKVIAAKTEAGIRAVPIAEKVAPFFEYWYNLNGCEYLLSTPEGNHFIYRNYYDSYWTPIIEVLGMKHRPHDTRHTCISGVFCLCSFRLGLSLGESQSLISRHFQTLCKLPVTFPYDFIVLHAIYHSNCLSF